MFSQSSLQSVSKMRTKEQQKIGKEDNMLRQIKTTAARSSDTLLGDAIGAAALMVMLIVGLYFPGLS